MWEYPTFYWDIESIITNDGFSINSSDFKIFPLDATFEHYVNQVDVSFYYNKEKGIKSFVTNGYPSLGSDKETHNDTLKDDGIDFEVCGLVKYKAITFLTNFFFCYFPYWSPQK